MPDLDTGRDVYGDGPFSINALTTLAGRTGFRDNSSGSLRIGRRDG